MADDGRTKLAVLGCTGSIGKQTLEVVDKHPDKYQVIGLAARDETDIIFKQMEKYKPKVVVVNDESAYRSLQARRPDCIKVLYGMEGLCELAAWPQVQTSVIALSGAVGILPTLAAIKAGKRVALANKETLVAAGDIVMAELGRAKAEMIPVDSEHSAIFQCLQGEERHLGKIWLTASGGPFRDFSSDQLKTVTVPMALKHPNWLMGPKITVDSASLMNKGLEVIEAHYLFKVAYDKIMVLIQNESIIHSMVELVDGAFLAHLGVPDMRIPIQYALSYPDRMASPAVSLDFATLGCIHFQLPDTKRFPALQLAYEAGRAGGTMPAVLNAANEVAVNRFIAGETKFTGIPELVEQVMLKHSCIANPDLTDILAADEWARLYARDMSIN